MAVLTTNSTTEAAYTSSYDCYVILAIWIELILRGHIARYKSWSSYEASLKERCCE